MIPRTRPNFDIASILLSLRHGRRQGEKCQKTRSSIAARIGVEHIILAPSGRGSLFLLLHCLPGGRVCIPAYTCSAVVEAAHLAGREVLFLEHTEGRINLSAQDIEGKLLPGDIYVMTHQFGHAHGVDAIKRCAEAQGAIVIEDIAASFGGTDAGKTLGSFGLAAFGSFDTSKLVHCPLKGGFIGTSDPDLAASLERKSGEVFRQMTPARMFHLSMMACMLCLVTRTRLYKFFHTINFRWRGRFTAEDGVESKKLNGFYKDEFAEWQAAVVLPQLEKLDEIIRRRSMIHESLEEHCATHPMLRMETTPLERPGTNVRFAVYAASDKLALYDALSRRGVDCGFSFTTIAAPGDQRAAWHIADKVLNIPCYPTLTQREIETILQALDDSKEGHDAG